MMLPKLKSPRQNCLLNLKFLHLIAYRGLPWGLSGKKNLPAIVEDIREGNGTPLQYSWLENPMDGGAW